MLLRRPISARTCSNLVVIVSVWDWAEASSLDIDACSVD